MVFIHSKLHDHDTKKQSDYVVEQSFFPLIALFKLKIGRCRDRNWLNGNQALVILFVLYHDNNVHFEGVRFICGPHLVIIGQSQARADLMAR